MIDVFVEGTKDQSDDRQYVTLTDFPVPVTVGTKGIYIKRVRMVLDVTGLGLSYSASQDEFEDWLESDQGIADRLKTDLFNLAGEIASDPLIKAEADMYLSAVGRTVK